MLALERRNQIIEKLRIDKVVSVHELALRFSTTDMTIRRDFADLERKGLITRSYGGAVFNEKVGYESEFITRQSEKKEIKTLLGKKAADFVTPGDSIGIDIGTTGLEVAKHIRDIPDLTVITSSIPVINELCTASGITLICTGGELSAKDMSLNGHSAINMLQDYVLDKVFIGVAGISFDHGFTVFNMQDALVKRVLIERALEVNVVAHSDKIGLARYASICNVEAANRLITDSGISDEDRRNFEDCGVEVVVV